MPESFWSKSVFRDLVENRLRPQTVPNISIACALVVLLVMAGQAASYSGAPEPSIEDVEDSTAAMFSGRGGSHPNNLMGSLEMARALIEQRSGEQGGFDRLLRNIELAQAIDRTQAGNLTTSSSLVQQISRWQVDTLGLEWVSPEPLTGFNDPREAVKVLAHRHDLEPDPDSLEALDALEEPLRSTVARLVDAFLALDEAAQKAFGENSLERFGRVDPELRDPGASRGEGAGLTGSGSEMSRVFSTRYQFIDAVIAVEQVVRAGGKSFGGTLDFCPAIALDLSGVDSTYTEYCTVVLDLGGDDRYYNNAGGNGFALYSRPCALFTVNLPAAALIDLGEGHDVYGHPQNSWGCGANGGGFHGVGLLVDDGGEERYNAADHGTNGGGDLGAGFLFDGAGNDTYVAGEGGANGGGKTGAGFLLDVSGDDAFYARGGGTNGGSDSGTGFLLDREGDDVYQATEGGTNGGSSGGDVGFLMDESGNDRYIAEFERSHYPHTPAANGGATGGGAGFLVDGLGDDIYSAGSTGTNGGAESARSKGFLVDHAGDDQYVAGNISTNGGGGDRGHGFLLDLGGDDAYQAGRFATNGGSDLNGNGKLIDLAGSDTYEDPLVPGDFCWDCTVVPKGEYGAQVDAPDL